MIHISNSEEETIALGVSLAPTLISGDCVAMYGELGAGKTQLVRGIVKGLGGEIRAVCSPTYVLLNIYATPRLRVFHLDAYRVSGALDFEGIGFAELLQQRALVIVEWADRVDGLLPTNRINARITHTGQNSRAITIERPG
ncbi:MAG: tRNA (adenosine(37)-N6)-threonylcarbamoyltransferase complex ATPase subunit type 1 TsaE [Tepidisphaeraceae bacterium]